MESVGFIALPGCPKKTVFYIVLHLLSNSVGFIALPDNRIKPTLVDFIALSGFSGFSI
jgi:ABC-type lipopolysaccharide export system ATPase subunit